jgi:hypothetical protein
MAKTAEAAQEAPDTAPSNGRKGKRGRGVGVPNIPVTFNGLRQVTKLPERAQSVPRSEFHNAMEQIKEQGLTGMPFELQTWGDDDRATRAAHTKASGLRKKYPEAEGWTIRVGPSELEPGRTGLVVQYG